MAAQHPVTLDSDVTKPSTSAPGYGPADTTDPLEYGTSVSPDKAAAKAAGHNTVNAIVKLGRHPEPRTEWLDTDRTETEQVTAPDGSTVTVERNLELGASRIIG